jgi:hypothetical protein
MKSLLVSFALLFALAANAQTVTYKAVDKEIHPQADPNADSNERFRAAFAKPTYVYSSSPVFVIALSSEYTKCYDQAIIEIYDAGQHDTYEVAHKAVTGCKAKPLRGKTASGLGQTGGWTTSVSPYTTPTDGYVWGFDTVHHLAYVGHTEVGKEVNNLYLLQDIGKSVQFLKERNNR